MLYLRSQLSRLNQWWLRYEYKHTSLALLLLLLFILLLDSALMTAMFGFIEGLRYGGVFLAGVLSVSFFTAVPALILIVDMAQYLDPFAMAVVAGAGAMVGDWLLMMFFQDKIASELRPLISKFKWRRLTEQLQHKYARWIVFVMGAFAIMTPAPDEIGIALLGISHFKRVYMLTVCFILDTLGFLVLVGLVRLFT